MALIRLTLVHEYVRAGRIATQPRRTLINTRAIEWVTTEGGTGDDSDRIHLMIKMVGDSEPGIYAAIDPLGDNSEHEAYDEEVLDAFRMFVNREEGS